MRHYFFIIIKIVFVFLLSGCKDSQSEIANTISKMQASRVSIPFDKMSCWINDSLQNYCPWEQAKLKLVVYTDSFACSQCTFKKMYLWKDFVRMEKKYNNKFYIFFIIQSGSNSTSALSSYFHYTELNHPMYIDSTNIFKKENPNIPSEEMFHVILLDENDSIILVGNPLFNTQIEDMLIKQVNERMRK